MSDYPEVYLFAGAVGKNASRVNGEFRKTSRMENGCPTYKLLKSERDILLWFWPKKKFWMISPEHAVNTQNAYACVRGTEPPHKMKPGSWLMYSTESQRYDYSELIATIPGEQLEDLSDDSDYDENILKPRDRSKTPGASDGEPASEGSESPEAEVEEERERPVRQPKRRETPVEPPKQQKQPTILRRSPRESPEPEIPKEKEEEKKVSDDEDDAPAVPRDERYFQFDDFKKRKMVKAKQHRSAHMDDPSSSEEEEEPEKDGNETEGNERNSESARQERQSPPKTEGKWRKDAWEKISSGQQVNHWESSRGFPNRRRNRGRGRGGRGRNRYDDQYDYGDRRDEYENESGYGNSRRSGGRQNVQYVEEENNERPSRGGRNYRRGR